MKSTDIDCNIYYLKNGLRVDFILFQSVEQYGKDMVLMKKRKWRLNICFVRYYLDNNDGEYRCRSKVPVNEIMKIVRMYEPIITEFFNNEEEMAKFNKWRDEQKLLEQNKLSEDGEEKKERRCRTNQSHSRNCGFYIFNSDEIKFQVDETYLLLRPTMIIFDYSLILTIEVGILK